MPEVPLFGQACQEPSVSAPKAVPRVSAKKVAPRPTRAATAKAIKIPKSSRTVNPVGELENQNRSGHRCCQLPPAGRPDADAKVVSDGSAVRRCCREAGAAGSWLAA